ILNKRDLSGKLAFQRMYEEVASSLRYTMTLDGKRKVLTGEQIRALRQRPDARLRTRAMKLYFTTYGRNSLVLTSIYNALLKDHQIECDLRHYDQAMDMRNLDNELDAAVVNTLSDVTNANVDIVQRYYRLKARMLHRGKLNMADLYAPVTDRSGMFTWDESKRIVLDAYRAFDKRAHDTIKEFFDHSWIDARTLPNKTGGAFCTFGVPGTHPFVMLNFTGTSRDVQTMAHELGHGMHSMLSAKQTMLNRNPILPLAEVASVFGEMLVTDHLLARTSGAEEKIALYAGKLEDTFATAFRQNMFHCFEVRTHALVADHSLS
ncbi:MAG: M3 family metallopeptidase, partial [Caldisericota bacterium]|nr:M3 family metallopeptidase [Caldisericota bacterium]